VFKGWKWIWVVKASSCEGLRVRAVPTQRHLVTSSKSVTSLKLVTSLQICCGGGKHKRNEDHLIRAGRRLQLQARTVSLVL
jgi:hypothetical protein